MEALAGLRRCDGVIMYSLQSIAKPSLANTLLHWKPLRLNFKSHLGAQSSYAQRKGGCCQDSSYLSVTVSFFKIRARIWDSLDICTYHRMFPQRGNLSEKVSAQTTVFSRKALDLSECKVATQGGGETCWKEGLIAVLCQDFSNSVTRYTPLFWGMLVSS